jgi:hypothetical protein
MKTKMWVLGGVTALVLLGVCVYQGRRLAQQQVQIVSLRGDNEQKGQEVHELRLSKNQLNQQGRELLKQAEAEAAKVTRGLAALPAAPALSNTEAMPTGKPGAETAAFGKLLSKMMEDPDTKQFIREQQRLMMDQLYAPLIKQLGLTSEEADKFKGLLSDHAVKAAERASSLFGSLSGTNRTEAFGTLAADVKAQQEQLKELLGEGRYAQYKEYQQTSGERLQLNMFKQQFGGESALTDQQTEQVLTLIKEEKLALAASGESLPGMGNDPSTMQAALSEDHTEHLLQQQDAVSQRVYERAKAFLSADQLDAFGRFQTNQLQTMRVGMTMARKLMGEPPAEVPAVAQPGE